MASPVFGDVPHKHQTKIANTGPWQPSSRLACFSTYAVQLLTKHCANPKSQSRFPLCPGTHRASGEEFFARLATSAVNSSLFLLIFTSAPEKQNQKQRPPKTPKPRKHPKRWTSTTSAHNRPEPRPETKPNRPTDRPRPGPDTGLVFPGREPTPNCTTKFSRVIRPLFYT